MRTFIDFDDAPILAIPTVDGSDSVAYEGMLIEGPQGWGEFSPPDDCDARALARWFTAAIEPGTVGWPDPVRGRVPVSVAVPAVTPAKAREIVVESGGRAVDLTVGAGTLAEDIARVEAVRDALGPDGALRCDAHRRWDTETAVTSIAALSRVTDIEFVARPCRTRGDVTIVRRAVDVPIAVDATGVEPLTQVADVAVLRTGALGGVRRAMRVAEASELPCVVSSAPQTSVGLAGSVALAGALPDLPFACALGVAASLMGDVVADARSLRPVDGHLPVAPMPPAPERALISRYTMADRARIAWWRERLIAAQAHGRPGQ
ncbi:MAG: enolase C-terminal domain-like protein [Mycobacterium sp.]